MTSRVKAYVAGITVYLGVIAVWVFLGWLAGMDDFWPFYGNLIRTDIASLRTFAVFFFPVLIAGLAYLLVRKP